MSQARHTCAPHEVVPKGLRASLRWDSRHDRMAAYVMREFGLSLPQHRELIRQLAFLIVARPKSTSTVVQEEDVPAPARGAVK